MSYARDNRFIVERSAACYLEPDVRKSLPHRVETALNELRVCDRDTGSPRCRACPRECRVDRMADQPGNCRIGRRARVSSAFAHMGEENCLRGRRGSGTIFFSGCNLHCVFCQNADLSQAPDGHEVDANELAGLMLALQREGCHNINLVTPEHIVPQIVEALALAIDLGLTLPIVYNTSAYDALSSLGLMDGLVDIYMPDFKLWSNAASARLLKAEDYPQRAREAIREMHRQVGDLRFTPDGVACRGVLVRHLVMPGMLEDSRDIFRWLAAEVSKNTHLNIMGQYQPSHEVGAVPARQKNGASVGLPADEVAYDEINRRPTPSEIEIAYEAARKAGLWRFDERPIL